MFWLLGAHKLLVVLSHSNTIYVFNKLESISTD